MTEPVKPLAPTRLLRETTLNDLIDRLLEKGLFLNTDLIIGVAGIPLLGVNLRLALAGMSTMIRYGFMRDWDEATRAWESAQRRKQEDLLMEKGERLAWSGFAAHWYDRGIYTSWRPGTMYLTDRRLVIIRREPREVLLEVPYREIKKLEIRRNTNFAGAGREELQLLLHSGDLQRVHAAAISQVVDHLSRNLGINIERLPAKQSVKLPAGWFKVWRRADRGTDSAWRPGIFYVEQGRLYWRAGEKERPEFFLWPPDLLDCNMLYKDTGTGLKNKPVLQIRCLARHDPETVLFSGPEEVLSFWLDTLQSLQGDELEVCPACGAPGSGRRLLDAGCGRCGWLSVRKRRLQMKKQETGSP